MQYVQRAGGINFYSSLRQFCFRNKSAPDDDATVFHRWREADHRLCRLKRLYSATLLKPLKNREKSAFFLINPLYTYTRLSHPFARDVFEFMQKGEP
ncbi:hypothetical protein [Agrobacterium deltaense]|uniref:hypothetical protein n=1 Tax=Agrobacterium deltaense TaxID=1183412 RepID=UPI000F642AB3|nr:hypothetical protein [Agrobacterium deltaense]RRN72709.1 hypothetical protein EIQ31_10200 [Agrobacterium deltaense]